MPNPLLPIRASVAIRWLRGECSRTNTHSASKIEVFPCALSPIKIAPSAGTTRSSD